MVFLKRGHNAAQHGAGNLFGGFFHLDDLEPSGQGRVFLEILFVLRPGGGGDGAQFSAGQRGFEQIGRIVLPGLPSGADHGVGFVDEEDDLFG